MEFIFTNKFNKLDTISMQSLLKTKSKADKCVFYLQDYNINAYISFRIVLLDFSKINK